MAVKLLVMEAMRKTVSPATGCWLARLRNPPVPMCATLPSTTMPQAAPGTCSRSRNSLTRRSTSGKAASSLALRVGSANCACVGEDQSRSLNSQVDRGSNQEDKSAKGEIFSAAVFGFKDCSNQHPKTEEISQTTVNSRALGTENNQISTVVNQSAEWRVSHE